MKNVLKQVCCVVIGLLVMGNMAVAQDEPERNWTFGLGAGVMLTTAYPGSNEVVPVPFPFINAEYKTSYLDVFVFGDETGIRLKTPALEGSDLSFGVKMGQKRL